MTGYSGFLARLNDRTAEHGEFISDTSAGGSPVRFRDAEGRRLVLASTLDNLVARIRDTAAGDL